MPLRNPGERQVGIKLAHIKPDHVARYQWATEQIASHVPQEKGPPWVCDMGCGVGYGTHMMAEAGNIVLGVDLDQETIDFAREHWTHKQANYAARDAASLMVTWKLGWRDHTEGHQVAVALEFIEHVEKPQDILAYFPGHYLFASVPDQRGRPFSKRLFPHHHRHYTPDEFLELLDTCGWEVVERYQQIEVNIESGWRYAGKSLLAVAQRREQQ